MKNKKITITNISVIVVVILQTIDVLFIHEDGSLVGNTYIAKIAGMGVIIISSILLNFNIKKACFKTYNWFFELVYGTLFVAVPFFICMGTEFIVLMLKGYRNLRFNVCFPNTNEDMSIKGALLAMGLFTATVLLEAVFQELFFRGFLITQFQEKFGISKSNVIQSLFFIVICVPEIYTKIKAETFEKESFLTVIFIVLCYIALKFISGLKWGLYFRVNGTLWMCVADNFAYRMLMQCLYITYSTMPLKWYILQALSVQIMSLALFTPLYLRRDKLNEEFVAEEAIRKELAGLHIDDYSPSPLRHYLEAKSAVRKDDLAKKRAHTEPIRMSKGSAHYEEPISLRDSGLFTATHQATEAPLDTPVEQHVTEDDGTAKIGENGKNIADLVNDYFEDNFKKHTF